MAAHATVCAVFPMRTVYFDYNATTPLDGLVREAMLPFLGDIFGNPSSVHHVGRRARASLDEARERVATVWRCQPSEVVFTSGGTESINLAILGVARLSRDRGRHIITSQVEHSAVLRACEYLGENEGFEITYLPVDHEGLVHPETLIAHLRADTILVSIQAANNEIGTLQPVAELGKICRSRGVLFHTDAVQWLGKLPFESIHQFNADLVSICAHKFHGPKGSGGLFIHSLFKPAPLILGGSQENERRGGTENLPGIMGFAEALERFVRIPVFPPTELALLTNRLINVINSLQPLGVKLHTPLANHLPNTVAFSVSGCDSFTLLAALDLEGICASSGSACSLGSLKPSHVILALGADHKTAGSLIRFSLGRESTLDEVEFVARMLPQIITRAKASEQPLGSF